jgi:hypothetical protein
LGQPLDSCNGQRIDRDAVIIDQNDGVSLLADGGYEDFLTRGHYEVWEAWRTSKNFVAVRRGLREAMS